MCPTSDDDRIRPAVAGKEMSDFFDRLLGRGKPDAHRRTIGQRLQPFERKRQMRAALVVGDRVDFIDDDGFDVAQDGAALSAVSRM